MVGVKNHKCTCHSKNCTPSFLVLFVFKIACCNALSPSYFETSEKFDKAFVSFALSKAYQSPTQSDNFGASWKHACHSNHWFNNETLKCRKWLTEIRKQEYFLEEEPNRFKPPIPLPVAVFVFGAVVCHINFLLSQKILKTSRRQWAEWPSNFRNF